MIEISIHAEERIRKRLGVKRKAVQKYAEDAVKKGKLMKDFKGRLKKYYEWSCIEYKSGNKSILFNNHIWVIQDDRLITVFPLPNRFSV